MTLKELKKTVGEHYKYYEHLSVRQAKKKLEIHSIGLAFEMIAGQLQLVVAFMPELKGSSLYGDIYMRDQSGNFFYYDSPDIPVALIDNMEAELFRFVNCYVETKGLSYTLPNGIRLDSSSGGDKNTEE